jgi:hypothetical protein
MAQGRQGRRRSLYMLAVGGVLPTLLLSLAIYSLVSVRLSPPKSEAPGLAAILDPIPIPDGDVVTLAEARLRVDYPIPLLPSVTLSDPCGGPSQTLSPTEVWASKPSVDRSSREIAIAYPLGIWMVAIPKNFFNDNVANPDELPSVEAAFPTSDFAGGTTTGTVRGHTAWVQSPDAALDCTTASYWAVPLENPVPPAPSRLGPYAPKDPPVVIAPTTVPTDLPLQAQSVGVAIHYAASGCSTLFWMEDGVVIHLVAPFPVAQLTDLAQGISFSI